MDKESGSGPAIGDLRWRVTIANRLQVPSTNPDAGITETYAALQSVHASIEPTRESTFYDSIAVDRPVSHRITMRWLDHIDVTQAILRTTTRKDGSLKTEVFRIRTIGEIGGRKRFITLSCELERVLP